MIVIAKSIRLHLSSKPFRGEGKSLAAVIERILQEYPKIDHLYERLPTACKLAAK